MFGSIQHGHLNCTGGQTSGEFQDTITAVKTHEMSKRIRIILTIRDENLFEVDKNEEAGREVCVAEREYRDEAGDC